MVARGGIEPPTHGFSVRYFVISPINLAGCRADLLVCDKLCYGQAPLQALARSSSLLFSRGSRCRCLQTPCCEFYHDKLQEQSRYPSTKYMN